MVQIAADALQDVLQIWHHPYFNDNMWVVFNRCTSACQSQLNAQWTETIQTAADALQVVLQIWLCVRLCTQTHMSINSLLFQHHPCFIDNM